MLWVVREPRLQGCLSLLELGRRSECESGCPPFGSISQTSHSPHGVEDALADIKSQEVYLKKITKFNQICLNSLFDVQF